MAGVAVVKVKLMPEGIETDLKAISVEATTRINKFNPKTLPFKFMVLPPVMLMLVPPSKLEEPTVVVATIIPFASKAKTFPADNPVRKVWPVVVELVLQQQVLVIW